MLSCLTCKVKFPSMVTYKDHVHSEWHKYNMKRAVCDLPALSEEAFKMSKNELKTKEVKEKISTAKIYCEPCRKMFTNEKSYNNHIQSKKHIEKEKNTEPEATRNEKKPVVVAEINEKEVVVCDLCNMNFANSISYESHLKSRKHRENEENNEFNDDDCDDDDTDSEFEIVDDDEWDGWNEDGAIPVNECLYCTNKSISMEENLEHMKKRHAFYIPEESFCTDVEGLLEYLGRKVGCGFACTFCYNGKKSFPSLKAVRNHMEDKFHMRYDIEGGKISEYIDFYGAAECPPDDNVRKSYPVSDNYQLYLPCGAIAWHRELKNYKHVKREQTVALKNSSLRTNKGFIRAIGGPLSSADLAKQKKDKKIESDARKSNDLSLGMKANKLQTYFRPQVIF